MDVLSEVLRTVKLEGALFFNGEFSAPWCISSPPSRCIVPYLSPGAGHLIIYHLLTEGNAYAKLEDGSQRVDLTSGDIVIFPHGDPHYLGGGSATRSVDGLQFLSENLGRGLKLARYGNGGEVTKFVCGYLVCEPRLAQVFLSGLPSILKVNICHEPSGEWIENSIRFSVGEVNQSAAGGGLVRAKLSEVLFVETIRCYINRLPADQIGWLAGARDPLVGQALALLHKRPEQPWTLASLGRSVGSSRTRLAERFRHFLGESPMAYLSRWRLRLGAELLASKHDTVAEIAATVGYGSEAAFNRAFKRLFGCPPAQFRRKRKLQPAQYIAQTLSVERAEENRRSA